MSSTGRYQTYSRGLKVATSKRLIPNALARFGRCGPLQILLSHDSTSVLGSFNAHSFHLANDRSPCTFFPACESRPAASEALTQGCALGAFSRTRFQRSQP